jgi:hypothetical protein
MGLPPRKKNPPPSSFRIHNRIHAMTEELKHRGKAWIADGGPAPPPPKHIARVVGYREPDPPPMKPPPPRKGRAYVVGESEPAAAVLPLMPHELRDHPRPNPDLDTYMRHYAYAREQIEARQRAEAVKYYSPFTAAWVTPLRNWRDKWGWK